MTQLASIKQFSKLGAYWNKNGLDEIDLIGINDLNKKIVIAEIKLNKNKINLNQLADKAKALLAPYHNYHVEYLALSLEDVKDYL